MGFWPTLFILFVLICVIGLLCGVVLTSVPSLSIFGGRNRKDEFFLYVQDPGYSQIASGKKTVEGRIGTIDKFEKWIGKTVLCKSGKNELPIEVKAVRQYKTVEDFVAKETWKKIDPDSGSDAAALKNCLDLKMKNETQVFSPQRVAESGGVVAVEFKLKK